MFSIPPRFTSKVFCKECFLARIKLQRYGMPGFLFKETGGLHPIVSLVSPGGMQVICILVPRVTFEVMSISSRRV